MPALNPAALLELDEWLGLNLSSGDFSVRCWRALGKLLTPLNVTNVSLLVLTSALIPLLVTFHHVFVTYSLRCNNFMDSILSSN